MLRLILTCTLLVACAPTATTTVSTPGTAPVVFATPEMNATSSVANQLAINKTCAAIARGRGTATAQAGINQLRVQAGFTETELAYISNGQIATGMTEKAGLCALGGTAAPVKEVSTVSSTNHVVKTFTFSHASEMLVTDNGIVTQFRP